MLSHSVFIGLVWWIDNAVSAIYKLKDTAETFKQKAQAFNSDGSLDNFKAASAALKEAGLALQEFGIAIYLLARIGGCGKLASKTSELNDAKDKFRDAAGANSGTGFQGVATSLGTTSGQNTTNKLSTEATYPGTGGDISFQEAQTKFGEAYTAFNTMSFSNTCDAGFKTAAQQFKNACEKFAIAAILFNTKVQSAKSDGGLTTIQAQFDTGTTGNGKPAKEFYNAADDLYNQIKNDLWPWPFN